MQQARRNERWAKVIPRQVISRAYEGSTDDLWNIQLSLTLENCSVDVLNAALRLLTTYDSTSSIEVELEAPDAGPRRKRALPCVAILGTSVFSAGENAGLKRVLAERLKNPEAVNALCRWMIFCLFTPTQSHPRNAKSRYVVSFETMAQSSRVLATLLTSNNVLVPTFLASTTFIDLVIHLWTNKLEGGKDLFIDMGYPAMNGCSTLWLLKMCIDNDEGRRIFLDRIEARGRPRELPFSFVQRANQLAVGRHPPTIEIMGYLFDLIEAVDKLVSCHGNLLGLFTTEHYMSQFSVTLNALSFENDGKVPPFHFLKSLVRLALHASVQTTGSVACWRDLISGEFIQLLRRSLESVPPYEPRLAGFCSHVTNTLSLFTMYPAVLRELRTLPNLPALSGSIPGARGNAESQWETLWDRAGRAIQLYKSSTGDVRLCDNVKCDRLYDADIKLKQCSRCSSVVYCSTHCQRDDWERFHKAECSYAREDHYNRKSTNSLYSHSTRAFHMRWIEDEYRDIANVSVVRSFTREHRGHEVHETLPMFLYLAPEQDIQVTSLRDKQWWDSKTHWPFTQQFLQPRVSALIEEYKSGAFTEDVQLIEGAFHFSWKRLVYLTVMLKRKGPGTTYKAVWGLAKHAIDLS